MDASTINVVDVTAVHKLEEFRDELAARGVMLGVARVKHSLTRFFDPQWMRERSEQNAAYRFATLKCLC